MLIQKRNLYDTLLALRQTGDPFQKSHSLGKV